MAELLLVKSYGGLKSANGETREFLHTVTVGEILKAQVTRPRNPKFARKFHAMMDLFYENQEQFNSRELMRKELIKAAGFYEEYKDLDGNTQREAKSISFAKMDETEFAKVYYAVLDVGAAWLGTDSDTLMREIEAFAWTQ